MNKFINVFGKQNVVIGMIHLEPLPGTPKYKGSVEKIISKACQEAEIYKNCGIDSMMVENMHDVPYVKSDQFGPETVSVMSRVCTEVRRVIPRNIPCGIQVLAGGNREGLAIAKACELDYVRVEGFVFSQIGDEGFLDATAGSLLRYRRQIEAESVLLFTDIKKKHSSHQITSDVTIEETARAAEFFLSDGVILTGVNTGSPADEEELRKVKESVDLPVLIGSGVTKENIHKYVTADAFIIGSYFKHQGRWENELSRERVLGFMEAFHQV